MIANPIIAKELVTTLRSRAAMILALVSIGLVSLLALGMWPAAGVNATGPLYARLFMTIIFAGQLVVLALFTPPFAATSITYERESNTWELLYYSMLRPDQILVGKLCGAVAFLILLVAFSLPAAAASFILGGVSPREMFLAYAVLLTAGVTFGLIGLTCSALLSSSFVALVVTCLVLLALCGGVHLPIVLLPEWIEGHDMLHAVRCLSPFSALLAVTKDAFRAMGPDASAGVVRRYFAYSGLLCGVMVLVLLARIAMRPQPKIARRTSVVDEASLGVRVLRGVLFVLDPRRRRKSIPLWLNPILVLDLRTRAAGLSNLVRACFACLIFSIAIVMWVSGTYGATTPDVIRLIALAFQMGLIGLIGPSLTIAAIAGEIESRTFDGLRMTPLRAWTVFFGKFVGSAMLSLMLIVSSMPVFFAVLYIQGTMEWRYVTPMVAVTVVSVAFTLASGLFFSSVCRTTARAGACAYGLVAVVMVGTLLGLALGDRLSNTTVRAMLAFNPIVTVVGAVAVEQFAEFGRWQRNVWALGVTSAALTVATMARLFLLMRPTRR